MRKMETNQRSPMITMMNDDYPYCFKNEAAYVNMASQNIRRKRTLSEKDTGPSGDHQIHARTPPSISSIAIKVNCPDVEEDIETPRSIALPSARSSASIDMKLEVYGKFLPSRRWHLLWAANCPIQ